MAYFLQQSKELAVGNQEISDWWRDKGVQFPMLQRVAHRLLSANATSTASERLFSLSGHIVSKKRSCLKTEKVDMLACLAYNMKKN